MKKVIIYTILLTLASATFSQQTNPFPPLTKQDYLERSKHQQTAAWILVAGGGGIALAGAISTADKWGEDMENLLTPEPSNDYTAEYILLIGGTIVALSSIPLFIASNKNKRLGISLKTAIKMEDINTVYRYSLVHRYYPALSLKINL
jgi:hypothetical protein